MAETTVSSLGIDIGGDPSGALNALNRVDNRIGSFADGASKQLRDVGKVMTLGISAPIVGIGFAAGRTAIQWESAFAGVRKTVDGTEEDLSFLERGLLDLATAADSPVSGLENAAIELAGIAENAGQLGIASEDILEFTETIGGLTLATNLSADEASTFAARFANVTGMDMGKLPDLANVIVDLGNNMAATEKDITLFAGRLAPLANYNWDEKDILAYSGALASLGVSPELGATNLVKSIADLTTAVALGGPELDEYARITGVTADEFSKLQKEDPEAAFRGFIEGLGKLSADEQILSLQKLGITSNEQITTLQRMAGGIDTVTKALDLADGAWIDSTALMDEVRNRTETTAAQMARLRNQVGVLGIIVGAVLLPPFNKFLDKSNEIVGKLIELDPKIIEMGVAFGLAAAAVGPLVFGVGLLLSPIGLLAIGVGAVAAAFVGLRGIVAQIDFAQIGSDVKEALSGFKIGDTEAAKIATDIQTKIQGAIDGVVIDTGSLDTLSSSIQGGVQGAVDGLGDLETGGVETWFTANTEALLGTLVSVAGIVFGGPVGAALGIAGLVSRAIESDFLGLGTFLTESGIGESIDGAITGLKDAITGIMEGIFGGEGMTGEAFNNFAGSFADGLEAVIGVAEQIAGPIIQGIQDLGTGIGDFFAGISGAETGGLDDVLKPIVEFMGSLLTLAGTVASAGIGATLSAVGEALGPIGTGIGQVITAVSRVGEGDVGGALESLGAGMLSIGGAILKFPVDLLDGLIEGVNDILGLDLPTISELFSGIGDALSGAWTVIAIAMDDVIRGVDLFTRQTKDKFIDFISGLRDDIKDATGFDIAPTIKDIQIAEGDQTGYIEAGNEVRRILEEQIAQGDIDLSQAFNLETSGKSFAGDLGQILSGLDASEIVDTFGMGAVNAVEQALAVSFANADYEALDVLVPIATDLGLDVAAIQGDFVYETETALAGAGIVDTKADIAADPALTNEGGIVSFVNSAIGSLDYGTTVNASVQVNPLVSFIGDLAGKVRDLANSLIGGIGEAIIGGIGGADGGADGGAAFGGTSAAFGGMMPASAGSGMVPAARGSGGSGGGGQAINVTVNAYGSSPHDLADMVSRAMKERGMD